jgi:hypothetical protein
MGVRTAVTVAHLRYVEGMSEMDRDQAVERVLNVLAPTRDDLPGRWPIFEFGKEETPTEAEVLEIAEAVVDAVLMGDSAS